MVNGGRKIAIGKCGSFPFNGAICLVLLAALVSDCVAQRAHRTVTNEPFNARARGLVGAIGVNLRQERDTKAISRLIGEATRRHDLSLRAGRPRSLAFLRGRGVWPRGGRLGLDAIVVGLRRGRLALPIVRSKRGSRSFGSGSISFQFQGFSSVQETQLRNFLETGLAILTDVYGPPVSSPPGTTRTVAIIQDPLLSSLDGGAFSPTTDEIRVPTFQDQKFDYFNLIHQVLHAFRGPLLLSFPAWEEGMARSAAIVAYHRIDPTFDPASPTEGDPLYLLPLYDLLNQPELGNSTFLSSSGYQSMAFWRIGMSAAAWLKVAAEDPEFYRKFNDAFYAAGDPDVLRGNVPALKELLSVIVPQVEGREFRDWFRRQWVFDNSVTTGLKLYVYNVPLEIGPLLVFNYYRTDPAGAEVPLTAKAHLIYRNDSSNDLYAEEGNETDIVGGEGFLSPQFFNVGGENRITIDVRVGNIMRAIPFPYMVHGPDNAEHPVFGAVLGAEDGTVTVSSEIGGLGSGSVVRGAFEVASGIDLDGFRKLSIEYKQPNAPLSVERRNVAFGYYVVLPRARPQLVTLTNTFPRTGNGFHMMGVPLILPFQNDESSALGIPANRLLLARWRPALPGINKFELYPRIAGPMSPGAGYYLKVLSDANVSITGTPVPTNQPFEIPLVAGFNQLANPFNFPVSTSDFRVALGASAPVDLSTAESNRWVQRLVWIFDPMNGSAPTQVVEPWQGFWIRALRPDGLRIFILPNAARGAQPGFQGAASRSSLSPGGGPPAGGASGWTFPLELHWEKGRDSFNVIGVRPGATDDFDFGLDAETPPEPPSSISLSLIGQTPSGPGRLAVDIRALGRQRKAWSALVESHIGDKEVTLTWSDLSALSKDIRPLLHDLDGERTLYMRTVSGYTFRTLGGRRRFKIEVPSNVGTVLAIRDIQPLRSPDDYIIAYTVSGSARLNAVVRSINGRSIRHLAVNHPVRSGNNLLHWDLRDDFGKRVPPGVYFIELSAGDDQERSYRATRTLMVR